MFSHLKIKISFLNSLNQRDISLSHISRDTLYSVWLSLYHFQNLFFTFSKRDDFQKSTLYLKWKNKTELPTIQYCISIFSCHLTRTMTDASIRLLPNYVATYMPITLVMIVNPILYLRSSKDMERIITCSSGQFTKRERDIIDAVKIKFSAINVVFYVCWFPNLVNGILLWSLWMQLPVNLLVTIWYLMVSAFTSIPNKTLTI